MYVCVCVCVELRVKESFCNAHTHMTKHRDRVAMFSGHLISVHQDFYDFVLSLQSPTLLLLSFYFQTDNISINVSHINSHIYISCVHV